ncbi:MAG TPA: hypothetical protein PK691_04510 [Thermomicrobiales bacterium]|nr:hypothetical protein [Thermomicrobiales bacterium]
MARTTINAIVATSPLTSATYVGVAAASTAADTSNLNQTPSTGKELLHVRNSGGSAYTVTVTSAVDSLGRTKDVAADSIAAGASAIYGPFPVEGWKQTDGFLYFQGSNAALLFTVIRLP